MPSVISPSAFMTGNAPGAANYSAPLMDFSPLAKLPQDYYAGTQMARTQALQNAFPQGLPNLKDANGNVILGPNGQPQIDTNAVMNTLTRLGGAEAAQAIMPTLINQQIGNQAAGLLAPNGAGAGAGPVSAPSAPASQSYGGARAGSGPNAGPANIVGNQPQSQTGPMAQEGQDSIRSLATEIFGGRDVTGLINSYSSRSGIPPDAPLSQQQAQQFTSFAGRFKLAAGQGTPMTGSRPRPQQPPVQNGDPSASGAPTSGTSAQERAINGGNAAPFVSGGTSGAPAPAPGPGGPNSSPAASGPSPTSAASVQVQPQYRGNELGQAQALRDEAQRYRAAAAAYGNMGKAEMAKAFLDQAQSKDNQANAIVEELRTGARLTEQQKNALDPRVQQAEIYKAGEQERQKGLIAAGQKQYEGIAANARSYETQQKGWLDTARGLFSQPELYTGVGSNMSQFVNRVKAAFANDPRGAEYQAVLGKVNAANILNTINQQKFDMLETGSNAGRIFAGQIDQAEKTSPGVENTIEANRALVELQTRVGKMNSEFGRQARDYLKTHRYLDAGFDEQLSKWVEQHPLLSQAEVSNPSLLGVPYAPPDRNAPEKVVAWAQRMGLQEGDPIRASDGRLVRVPRLKGAAPVQAGGVPPANAAAP